MQRWSTPSNNITPGQALYVVERLVREGRVSAMEVRRYIDEMHREIRDLDTRLQRLIAARGAPPSATIRIAQRSSARDVRSRRRPRVSGQRAALKPFRARRRRRRLARTPEAIASRQLQGRYLALIRQIPANKRGQYSQVAKEKGRETAIERMQQVVKK